MVPGGRLQERLRRDRSSFQGCRQARSTDRRASCNPARWRPAEVQPAAARRPLQQYLPAAPPAAWPAVHLLRRRTTPDAARTRAAGSPGSVAILQSRPRRRETVQRRKPALRFSAPSVSTPPAPYPALADPPAEPASPGRPRQQCLDRLKISAGWLSREESAGSRSSCQPRRPRHPPPPP